MYSQESFLDETSFQDWDAAITPKVRGSWNLHQCLPQGLDFFVLLSSSMGIIGTKKLAGYNAGNTYQAALARHRRARGQAAVCIDLGGVLDEGYVAEKESEKGFFQRNKHLIPISMDHFHGLLRTYCLQPGTDKALAEADPEMIIGLSPPAHWSHKVGMVPFTMRQPFWGHMHHLPIRTPDGGALDVTLAADSGDRKRTLNEALRLVDMADCPLERAAEVVSEALGEQVSRLLGTGNKPLEHDTPLQQIGIDSLSAIDLRDWVRRAFDVEVPVFELLDGSCLRAIGRSILSKLRQEGGE